MTALILRLISSKGAIEASRLQPPSRTCRKTSNTTPKNQTMTRIRTTGKSCCCCVLLCVVVVVVLTTLEMRVCPRHPSTNCAREPSTVTSSSPSRAPKTGAQLRDNPEEREKCVRAAEKPLPTAAITPRTSLCCTTRRPRLWR